VDFDRLPEQPEIFHAAAYRSSASRERRARIHFEVAVFPERL